MGLRGSAPQPTALRKLNGNPGKRPFNPNEPKVRLVDKLDPPADFSERKKHVWFEVTRELAAMRGLSPADYQMLVLYVDTLAECQRLIQKINSFDDSVIPVMSPTKVDKNGDPLIIGMKTLPYTQQLKAQKELALRFAMHFGMTPSARSKIVFIGTLGGTGTGNIEDPFDAE